VCLGETTSYPDARDTLLDVNATRNRFGRTPRLGIGVLSGGREDLVLACLQSARKNAVTNPYVVLVCDGWLPSDAVKTLADETILIGGINTDTAKPAWSGISKGWNTCLQAMLTHDVDVCVIQNDDTWLPPTWDQIYLDAFLEDPRRHCVCAVDRGVAQTLFPDIVPWTREQAWSQLPPDAESASAFYPGGFAAWVESWDRLLRQSRVPSFLPCRMNGAGFALTRTCVETLGGFDETFKPPGTSEDHDYWMRLLLYYGPNAMGTATKLFMHHWRSATLSVQPRQWAEGNADRNAKIFERKWLSTPDDKRLWDWFGTPPGEANAFPWNVALVPPPSGVGTHDPRACGPTYVVSP